MTGRTQHGGNDNQIGPAERRYAALSAAFGNPAEIEWQGMLGRFAAWTTTEDVDALIFLIRRQIELARHAGRDVGLELERYRSLVVEIAERFEPADPASTHDWMMVAIPAGLAARIEEAAK